MIKDAVRHKLGRHCQFLLTNLGRAGIIVACLVGIPASFGESTSITAQAPFQVVAKGFEKPTGLAVDPKGAFFLTDSKAGVLYRLTPGFTASGVPAFTSSVVFAGLDEPEGLAVEREGHLLVAEADKDRLVRFAKLTDELFAARPEVVVDGLKEPRWLTVDGEGGIFVSAEEVKDKKLPKGQPKPKEEVLLKLSPEGTLSIVADRFEELRGVTIDPAGTLYAAAKGRKGADEKRKGKIFRIHLPDGKVSTAIAADFKDPVDLKFDALGALFFTAKKFEQSEESDADKHQAKDDSAESREADDEDDKDDADEHGKSLKGVILKATFKDDGTLKALAVFASGLGDPAGLALDHDGNLYVAERKHGKVLRFQAPDAPKVEPPVPAFTRTRTLTVRGKAEPKALITVTGGASLATGLAEGSSGTFAIDVTLTADSEQTLRVFATGSGGDGLTSRATKAAVTQDDIPPDTNISGCPTGPLTTSTATFGFSGTDNLTPPGQLRFASSLDTPSFSPFNSNTSLTFTTLKAGPHTLRVKAQDQAANEDLTPEECTFTVSLGNRPPQLTPIGNRTVALGSTLAFTVTATDPENDFVTFALTPLPLPPHASFHSETGEFVFTPDATQVGAFSFNFIAGDGKASSSETITVTVTGATPGGVTSLSGRVDDTSRQLLANLTVTLKGTTLAAVTDAQGRFTLTNIPTDRTGRQQVVVTGFASGYANLVAPVDIIPNVLNQLPSPLTLPPVDMSTAVTVNPNVPTVVQSARLNVSVTIPPHTAKNADGTDYTGVLTISPVPEYGRVEARPVELRPGLSITIQPAGIRLNPPAPITFPNVDNLAPGNDLDLWSLSPDTGTFVLVGQMRVSADGQRLETVSGGVQATAWHFALPPNPQPNQSGNDQQIGQCTTCPLSASGADLQEGALAEDLVIPGIRSLGQARDLTLHYRSTSADAHPILPIDAFLSVRAAVPQSFSARLSVGGTQQGAEVFWNAAGLPENADSVSRLGIQFDASSLLTGRYPYELMLFSNYPFSSIGGASRQQVLVRNERASPIGAGWTVAGLDRIYPQADGALVVAEGGGATKNFTPQAGLQTVPLTAGIPSRPATLGELFFERTVDLTLPEAFEVWLLGAGAFPLTTPTRVDDVLELTVVHADGRTATFSHDYSVGCSQPLADFPPQDVSAFFRPGQNRVTVRLRNSCGGSVGSSALVLVTHRPAQPFYTTTFEGGAGTEWSPTTVSSTPVGARKFLGEFTNDTARLTLGGLPAHTGIQVKLNLFILKSWDGNGTINPCCGPDLFSLSVDSGPRLFNSTFSNHLPADQAYPGTYPGASNPAGTGAAETNTLGYPLVGDPPRVLGDSVYNLSFTFPHLADSVSLNFTGTGLQAISDESWGLDNVSVALLPPDSVAFQGPPDDFSTLLRNADGTFTRTLKDGTTYQFNARGFQTSVSDRNGNVTTYAHDGSGRLTTITDPAGLVTTLAYSGTVVATITDPAGRVTRFEHDADGSLTATVYANNSRATFSYDPQHRLIQRTDTRNNTYQYAYDYAGRFSQVTLPTGETRRLSPSQRIAVPNVGAGEGTQANPAPLAAPVNTATFTDGQNHATTFELDALGRVTKQTDALGRATTTERDQQGNPTRIIRANGAVTTLTYDEKSNLLTSTEQAIAATTTFTYDPTFNQVTSITDPKNNTTTITYDAKGNPTQIKDAENQTTTLTYDSRGLLTSTKDALNQTTTFTYNSLGRLTTTTDPLNRTTTLTYDAAGNVATSTDALNRVTSFEYDAFNRLKKVTDPTNGVSQYTYDGNGNLLSVKDAKNQTTTFAYDARNRLASTTDPLGKTESYTYDGADNLMSRVTPKGETISFAYDAVNQLLSKTLPANQVTAYSYDNVGNLTGVTDPDSALTMSYDLANRLTSVSTAGSTNQPAVTLTYTYDKSGNRLTLTDPTGINRYTYDPLNRLMQLTQGLTSATPPSVLLDEPFDAENGGGVLNYTGFARWTVTRGCVDLIGTGFFDFFPGNGLYLDLDGSCFQGGRLESQALFALEPGTYELTFSLGGSQRGDTNSVTVALGTEFQETFTLPSTAPLAPITRTISVAASTMARLSFDHAGGDNVGLILDAVRLSRQADPTAGSSFSYQYDALSRRTSVTLSNGTQTTYSYDPASQVTNILHKIVSSATQINKADYVYNNVGNRTSLTDRRGVQNFGYDGLDRLTQASHPLLLTPQAFVYDAVGNRTTGGSVVNAANQLTADATHSYQYDDNGNLTRKTLLANGNHTDYTYDAENRLIRVDEFAFGASTPFATSTYRYDGLGRRIEKVGNGITRRYIYDAEDILLEYDETNTLQARYTRGPGIDEPLAMTRGGATFFYHQDGLGTVTDLTDGTGATVQSYAYDAWGNIIQQTGTVENPYTYTGREFDAETGLYYYRARYYDPNTGRFNREDPLFAGKPFPSINPKSSHLYTYALNNPTTVTDPSGLEPCPDLGISEYGLVKTLQVILEALGKKVGAIGGLSLEVGEASVVAAQGIVPLIERNRKLNQAVEASGLSKADIEYGGYFRKTVQESWIIKLYIKLSK